MASQITKNRPTKMMLRRLLLAIPLYSCRILRHRRCPDSGEPSEMLITSAVSGQSDLKAESFLLGPHLGRPRTLSTASQ